MSVADATKYVSAKLITIGYLALVLVLGLAFLRMENISQQLHLESQRRAYTLCEQANRDRTTTRYIVEGALTLNQEIIDSSDISVQEYFQQIQPRREAFLDDIGNRLRLTPCPPDPDSLP